MSPHQKPGSRKQFQRGTSQSMYGKKRIEKDISCPFHTWATPYFKTCYFFWGVQSRPAIMHWRRVWIPSSYGRSYDSLHWRSILQSNFCSKLLAQRDEGQISNVWLNTNPFRGVFLLFWQLNDTWRKTVKITRCTYFSPLLRGVVPDSYNESKIMIFSIILHSNLFFFGSLQQLLLLANSSQMDRTRLLSKNSPSKRLHYNRSLISWTLMICSEKAKTLASLHNIIWDKILYHNFKYFRLPGSSLVYQNFIFHIFISHKISITVNHPIKGKDKD